MFAAPDANAPAEPSSLSFAESTVFRSDVTNIKSNMNVTSRVRFPSVASYVACNMLICVGRTPVNTYLTSLCLV